MQCAAESFAHPFVCRDLQTLIDAASWIAMLLDAEGRVAAINECGRQHFGIGQEQLLGRGLSSLFDESLTQVLRECFKKVVATGVARECEEAFGDLAYRHKLMPVRNGLGQVAHVAMFSEDISERHRLQRELQQSEMKYRFIAEHADDIIWQLDADMNFVYVNPASERIRGYSSEELLGQSVMNLYTPEGLQIVERIMRDRAERIARGVDTPAVCFEVPQYRRDGSVMWVETTSSRVADSQGRTIGYLGITRDVDARVRDRAALEVANLQLQQRIKEISELQERLWQQAVRDALTGLYNRHYLHDILQREFSRAARGKHAVSVVLVDVDHFKLVNDSYGHRTGDKVLKTVAELLQSLARESDVVCRWGGEEFLILLPGVTSDQARVRAESWRETLAAHSYQSIMPGLQITASFGVASYPQDADQPEALIHCADEALYASKQGGRNRVTVFDFE